jgi:uncharacterized protein involved in exopolysaccharide biosynthesis
MEQLSSRREYKGLTLRDYISVLLKNAGLVTLVTIVAIGIAVLVTLVSVPKYSVETVLEIGQTKEGSIESPSRIVEKIGNGAYSHQIAAVLGVDDEALPRIKTSHPGDTQILVLTTQASDAQKGKDLLATLTDSIIKEHAPLIESKRAFLSAEIARLERQRQVFEKTLEAGITLDTTAPLNQVLVINSLQSQIAAVHMQAGEDRLGLESIKDTRVIKPATASSVPLGLGLVSAIIVAGILGIIFGMFAVFLREWWRAGE